MIFEAKKLPQYKEIKNLETFSKKDGSGIRYEDLIGTWKFNSVWKKGSEEIDNISSSILQVLSAQLELEKNNSLKIFLVLELINMTRKKDKFIK